MKKDAKQKLHQATIPELETQLLDLSKQLSQRIQEVKLNRSKNNQLVRHLRHQIVIIKTIIRAKQLQTTV